MNASDIKSTSLDSLLAIFFNCNTKPKSRDFIVSSTYRETKFLKLYKESYLQTAQCLSEKYGMSFAIRGTTIYCVIHNDMDMTYDDFLAMVYSLILVKISTARLQYNLDAEIALAMFIFRGSADFNRGYYSVDIKNSSKRYFDDMFKILLSSDNLLSHLNLNFRELQPEYTRDIARRNTQVRVNLKWFYNNVICKFPNINRYKTDILTTNYVNLGEVTTYRSFEDRLVFYRENILGRSLLGSEVNALRAELDFSNQEIGESHSRFETRNHKIVSFARETFTDECVGCKGEYEISNRTFKVPRNGRWYLEINHVIPYANDSEKVDVLDNLVKLCPACHRALTPRRAAESLQTHIIEKMLESRDEVMRFVRSMMPNPALSPVTYVFDRLK